MRDGAQRVDHAAALPGLRRVADDELRRRDRLFRVADSGILQRGKLAKPAELPRRDAGLGDVERLQRVGKRLGVAAELRASIAAVVVELRKIFG